MHVRGLALGLAAQVVLGQGRALVGPVRLVADQHHAPVEALLAEGFGSLGAGKRGTDDDVGIAHDGVGVTPPRNLTPLPAPNLGAG
jgi:hypothetical protein